MHVHKGTKMKASSFIKYYQYIINIKLSLRTCLVAYGPQLPRGLWTIPAPWSMDHNCPVAYGPHLPCSLWTTPASWSMDHNCPVAYGPHLPCGPRTRACHGFLFTKLPRLTLGLRSWMQYSPISGNPQHAIYQVPIGTERVKSRAGITQHKYTQLEFIN